MVRIDTDMRIPLCQSEARRLRQEFNLKAPPVDVEKIAGGLFLQVVRKSPWPWNSRGLLRREEGEIWVNDAETLRGQRFCIGHEIGHFILHPDLDVFSEHVDPDSADYAADPMKALDDEAEYFSSVLLVPPDWLKRDVERKLTPIEMAHRYDVSKDVIFIALKQHRLLSKVTSPRR